MLALLDCAPTPPAPPHAGNDIGDEGGKELAEALSFNTTLTTLNLNSAIRPPRVGSRAAASLLVCLRCEIVRRPRPTPPYADNGIGAEGGKELAAALRVNTTLITLVLDCAIRLLRIGSHAAGRIPTRALALLDRAPTPPRPAARREWYRR